MYASLFPKWLESLADAMSVSLNLLLGHLVFGSRGLRGRHAAQRQYVDGRWTILDALYTKQLLLLKEEPSVSLRVVLSSL
jgi:hypothetical protein